MLTLERCYAILKKEGVPKHIVRHSEKVALVSLFIGCKLKKTGKFNLDIPLLIAGSLLHDVKKHLSILTGINHALAGYEFLKNLGYVRVAEIVKNHVNIDLKTLKEEISEDLIVYYADKRVKHEIIVSLEERFEDLKIRYGKTIHAQIKIGFLEKLSFLIENKIFKNLDFGPEKIQELEVLDKEAKDVFQRCFKNCFDCRGKIF